MYTALTIAGSDSSGGAGIQADIKTMCAHGIYAMSAITAITAQNTMGVSAIMDVGADMLGKQLEMVFQDIFPDAVKIGMLSNLDIMKCVKSKLIEYKARNIVIDPVMVSTSGSALVNADSVSFMKTQLFPLASIITPNIPETEKLTGISIKNTDDMAKAGMLLYEYIKDRKRTLLAEDNTYAQDMYQGDTAVLIKGGHSINDANDILVYDGIYEMIEGERVNNSNTHGTGCTLSSAIASNLAKKRDILRSVRNAKTYILGAIKADLNLGQGSGPLNHLYFNNYFDGE